jgi:hypothetical protein
MGAVWDSHPIILVAQKDRSSYLLYQLNLGQEVKLLIGVVDEI